MASFDAYKALYIHIPFCKKRCAYCDFATRAVERGSAEMGEYVDRLILDIRRAAKTGELSEIETVYIGGGTPSHLGAKQLSSLLYALGVSMSLTSSVECSMEANPESLTPELVRDLYALGVNRLSIGVQSFDDELLGRLGRVHDGAQAAEAVLMARDRFDNVSVDLMCGIPGQTPDMFLADLERASSLGVSHLSVYPLTIEEGTPFDRLVESGEMRDVSQDEEALMMGMAPNVLVPAGFARYEVASYAKEGFECRHNQAYWTGVPYLGLGESAVTMRQDASHRERVQDGQVIESLDRRQMLVEDLMMRMRMAKGVSEEELRAAALLVPRALEVFRSLVHDKLVRKENGRYLPTLGGWLLGNEVYGRIYELAP